MTEPIPALRLTKSDGKPYCRPNRVEACLVAIRDDTASTIAENARIRNRTHPKYVHSEALLHRMRANLKAGDKRGFEILYRALERRIEAVLRSKGFIAATSKGQSSKELEIYDYVTEKFIALLLMDKDGYSERLDFFECTFFTGIDSFAKTKNKSVRRRAVHTAPLNEEDTQELTTMADDAQRVANWFAAEIDNKAFRSKLAAAIDSLPDKQRRTMLMWKAGIPVESNKPDVATISGQLSVDPRTVRNLKRKAIDALKEALGGTKT